MKKHIIIVVLLLVTQMPCFSHIDMIQYFKNATIIEIDTISVSKMSIDDIEVLTNYSLSLVDSSNDSTKLKGEICLSVLFEFLCNGIQNSYINKNDEKVKRLLLKYSRVDYHCPVRTPNWIKLIHYTCQGNYGYILKRAEVNVLFYPMLLLLSLNFVLYAISLFGYLNYKLRILFISTNTIILVITFFLFIVFKISCNSKFVQNYLF